MERVPLTDATLNGFARSLTERFATRASGLDADSARIVASRPSDRVLTGFLTPGQDRGFPSGEAEDDRLAEDLPQDSAYEQTSVGFEWLAPRDRLLPGTEMSIAVSLAVYVRRLPSFEEQRRHGVWRLDRRADSQQSGRALRSVGEHSPRYAV